MHEWHTRTSRNPLNLINEFENFEYETDYGERLNVTRVSASFDTIFDSEEKARTHVCGRSYHDSQTAYLVAFTTKKRSVAYQKALDSFKAKYNEYKSFEKGLTIGYGRKSSKVTCPTCGSSINLRYGSRFRCCPVCTSSKIISDSNWKTLETRRKLCVKAAENLSKEAEKNDIMFLCGIEWHC